MFTCDPYFPGRGGARDIYRKEKELLSGTVRWEGTVRREGSFHRRSERMVRHGMFCCCFDPGRPCLGSADALSSGPDREGEMDAPQNGEWTSAERKPHVSVGIFRVTSAFGVWFCFPETRNRGSLFHLPVWVFVGTRGSRVGSVCRRDVKVTGTQRARLRLPGEKHSP